MTSSPSVPRLITKRALAARYSVHAKTVEKWVDCGILPMVRINIRCVRFDVYECDQAMQRRTWYFQAPDAAPPAMSGPSKAARRSRTERIQK